MPRRNYPKRNRRETAQAVAELRQARRELAALPGTTDETPEYRRLNESVAVAERAVPWHRR